MTNIAAALAIPAAVGYAASVLLLTNAPLSERLSLSYPMGTGILTATMFLLGIMHIPFTIPNIAVALLLASAAMLQATKRPKTPATAATPQRPSPRIPAWQKLLFPILIAWVLWRIATPFYVALQLPIWGSDVLTNWSLRAAAFYHDRGLCLHPDDYFARSAGVYSYPIHNMLMQVWMSLWSGSFDKTAINMWVPPYLASAALSIYLSARTATSSFWSTAAVLFFLSSPLLMVHATTPYSDLVLGVYLLMAYTYYLKAIKGQGIELWAAGTLTCQALFVKNEAVFFAAALCLTTAYWAYRNHPGRTWQKTLPMLAPCCAIIPYYAFKLANHIGFGQSVYQQNISFHAQSITAAAIMETIGSFNFVTLAATAALYLSITRRPARQLPFVAAPVLLYALSFMAIYIFSDDHAAFLLQGTTFFRNMMTYYPMLYLLALTLLTDIHQQGPKSNDTRPNAAT